jgi:protoporphyrinogen/coproporphyrinogen III oxidase
MDCRVIIVGAGISGLAAAYTLKKSGISAIVLEKSSFPGGRMSSETVNGFIIDKGAYTVPEAYTGLKRFLDSLGMGQRLVPTPSTSSTFFDGKEYDVKIGSPIDLMKFKLLSVKNKLNLLQIALYAQSLGKALSISYPTDKSFELEQETATAYLKRNYDDTLVERIAYPLFCEILLGNPEVNSKLSFLATIANLTKFGILAFDTGMGVLPQYLATQLDVRLETPVYQISRRSSGNGFEIQAGSASASPLTCETVIFALPLPCVADIIAGISDELHVAMKSIEYNPSIVTAWGTIRRNDWQSMLNNFSRKDTEIIGTVISDNQKSPNRVPPGKDLITVILKEAASRELINAPDELIQQKVLQEMDKLRPSFSNQVEVTRTYRWTHAAVQFPPGALLKRKALREQLAKELNHIYIAGDSLSRTAIEASLATGIEAAQAVIKAFK